jgi:REP element-mobilizing transposase RayT
VDKFNGKYRINSARWAGWDYGRNAAYFVTICTANRSLDFGKINDGVMVFNPLGQMAHNCWQEIPRHFPFVLLDVFIVMPNHIHGILVINKPDDRISLTGNQPGRFGPQSQNLASIVRGYKIGVTKFARQNGIPFTWQSRYHDHVIRNPSEHERIRRYIIQNPLKWAEDTMHK